MTNTIPPNSFMQKCKKLSVTSNAQKNKYKQEDLKVTSNAQENKYRQEDLKANQGWMANIDKMDGNPDGWVKVETLYQQFPGLKKEISGVNTKYENGTIFYNASQMAEFITKTYNNK